MGSSWLLILLGNITSGKGVVGQQPPALVALTGKTLISPKICIPRIISHHHILLSKKAKMDFNLGKGLTERVLLNGSN